MNPQNVQKPAAFSEALVFGFDLGTASIGYAVRKGGKFLDVGVLLCPEDTADLESRRELRRQRRTTNNRNRRRNWFAGQLNDLGIPTPTATDRLSTSSLLDPLTLRVRALNGEELSPLNCTQRLPALAKRRGYQDGLPWAGGSMVLPVEPENSDLAVKKAKKKQASSEEEGSDITAEDKKKAEEEESTKKAVAALREEMKAFRDAQSERLGRTAQAADLLSTRSLGTCTLGEESEKQGIPLADLWAEASPEEVPTAEPRQRKEVWPREFIEQEIWGDYPGTGKSFPTTQGSAGVCRHSAHPLN